MKVLMVSPRISGIGGVAQHVSTLTTRLRADGHQVDVMSVEGLVHIPVKGLYNPSFTISSYMSALWGRLIAGRSYDVVHAHNFPAWPAAWASRAGRKILTVHGLFASQHQELHGRAAGGLAGWLEGVWGGQASVITCISKGGLSYYGRMGRRTAWIPNAVDVSEMPAEGIRVGDRQVSFVGRLSREKGVDVLIDALKLIDESITVVVVGSGKYEEQVRAATRRHGNLRFVGYQPHDIALRYIKGSDAVVVPSRQEGLPTVILEAMAMKVPVMASDIPEITDVSDALTVFRAGDPQALAQAINGNIGRTEMIETAWKDVMERYSWDIVYRKYLEVYGGNGP